MTKAKSFIAKAERALSSSDFERAMLNYNLSIAQKPDNEDAVIGIMLCNYAKLRPDVALMIFELYEILRSDRPKEAKSMVINLIESAEKEEIALQSENESIDPQDGIAYDDFKRLIKSDTFSSIYEKTVWSTNVFISHKSEWLDFLERLIEHGYTDMAYFYLEEALPLWGADERTRTLLNKLKAKEESALQR
ncbi:MAG: hypothetical protein LBT81_03800 [Helicobacteraceae bacterium]|nr:hypothetical protein [Helicobacteraceae bacterium]